MVTNFYMDAGDRYYGRGRFGFFPTDCWEDGWAESSRWAGEDDGTLVWDRNGDGIINDGSELFGDNTVLANGEKAAHGFEALAELDTNNDGVVDASDAAWSNLQVLRWTDANENGVMDDDEQRLVSLAEAGVSSLGTRYLDALNPPVFGRVSAVGDAPNIDYYLQIYNQDSDGDGIPDIDDIVDESGNHHLQVGRYTGTDGV